MTYKNTVYLIVTHIEKSKNGEEIEIIENVKIVDAKPKSNDMSSASVILDLLNGEVIKDRFDQDSVYREYVDRYKNVIGESLAIWSEKSEENKAVFDEIFANGGLLTYDNDGEFDDEESGE